MQAPRQEQTMPVADRSEVIALLRRTGSPESLVQHVVTVCERALKIAEAARASKITIDMQVVEFGALLHDCGIPALKGRPVSAPEWGDRARGLLSDNLMHPILGFQLARDLGFPLAIQRCVLCHTPGPTRAECVALGLPDPGEELLPVSMEEKIVMYADFVTWTAMLELNPWQDERLMAEAGIPYFNIFWRAAFGTELSSDGEVAQRWIGAQRELGRFARPEWFGL